MRRFLTTIAYAALVPAIAWASDTHSGHDMASHEAMEGIHAEATVNSISAEKVNVTHGPIAEIGWPAMTMDLGVLDGAEIEGVEAGDEVMMMLEKGPDGMFAIRALMPKE
ncbi:MAG: copper-binding protein [Roseovarius sp.]